MMQRCILWASERLRETVTRIPGPKRPTTLLDRHLDCEEAIEAMFKAVAAAAEAAGCHGMKQPTTAGFGYGVFLKSPRLL